MEWKKALYALEQHKEWDMAIALMEDVIQKNPNDMDAYIYFLYFFMNLLLEEWEYDTSKDPLYTRLATEYFQKSYLKFCNNPEYLFFVGMAIHPAPWYFGIEKEDAQKMYEKALTLEPNNVLYQWNAEQTKEQKKAYAQEALNPHSFVQKILQQKGSLGEYLIRRLQSWDGLSKYDKH